MILINLIAFEIWLNEIPVVKDIFLISVKYRALLLDIGHCICQPFGFKILRQKVHWMGKYDPAKASFFRSLIPSLADTMWYTHFAVLLALPFASSSVLNARNPANCTSPPASEGSCQQAECRRES